MTELADKAKEVERARTEKALCSTSTSLAGTVIFYAYLRNLFSNHSKMGVIFTDNTAYTALLSLSVFVSSTPSIKSNWAK